jgi:hypothetical protein
MMTDTGALCFDHTGDMVLTTTKEKYMTREEQQRRKQDNLSHDYLKSRLDYDPTTGVFTWKHYDDTTKGWNTKHVGKRAGSVTYRKGGYATRSILIDHVSFLEHRLAWFYMTGEWPNMIDHDNRDATDNRWDNLTEADYRSNSKNISMSSRNQSGVVGVRWKESFGKWTASIRIDGKETHLGSFDMIEAAERAVVAAREKHGYSDGHGQHRPVHQKQEPRWPLLVDSQSGVRGVELSGKRFRVRVKGVHGGTYETLEEAVLEMLELRYAS